MLLNDRFAFLTFVGANMFLISKCEIRIIMLPQISLFPSICWAHLSESYRNHDLRRIYSFQNARSLLSSHCLTNTQQSMSNNSLTNIYWCIFRKKGFPVTTFENRVYYIYITSNMHVVFNNIFEILVSLVWWSSM